MKTFVTRLTRELKIRYPIVLAPMGYAAGGALAAAVSRVGGLGLIGGCFGDDYWLKQQFAAARGERVGVGFVTWSLRKSPGVLTQVLKYKPPAVMLSFGDPRPFVDEIRAAGAKLICQCQNLEYVMDAVDAGADIIVVQGSEAGGHGSGLRGTLTLVPEAADYLASHAPGTLLLAAGGIGDGRGLAAVLMLGADGALVGSRLKASREALVVDAHHQALLDATGDDTIRTTVGDIGRQITWPRGFDVRMGRNRFTDRWHGREAELEAAIAVEGPRYRQAFEAGDPDNAGVLFGEVAGLIHSIDPAEIIVQRMAAEAAARLEQSATLVHGPAVATTHGPDGSSRRSVD